MPTYGANCANVALVSIVHCLALFAAERGKLLCLVLVRCDALRDKGGFSAGGVLNALTGYLIQSLVEWGLKGRSRIEFPGESCRRSY